METAIVWFRQDLRLSDHPALYEAAKNHHVLPIYILDDNNKPGSKIGGASRWWLHHSLSDLNKRLDNKLSFYRGDPKTILIKVAKANNIHSIYWNKCYEKCQLERDKEIEAQLSSNRIECHSFNGSLLWEPEQALKSDGTPYRVFTAFYRNGCLNSNFIREPLSSPAELRLIADVSNGASVDELELLHCTKWHEKFEQHWEIGEEAAQKTFHTFLDEGLLGYKEGRNFPAKHNVSRLSPHLHFGEISPNQVWYGAIRHNFMGNLESDLEHFLSELCWREFSHHLLFHFPNLVRSNLNSKFDDFTWGDDADLLQKWQTGQTGYPLVDAGMRELWQTGYMHNRVRMIVGSFLTKNLLLHWRHGAKWFWDCLVDADTANNSVSWQWVAGCGVDAAPYFRIFNPVTQGQKFDSSGEYTRRFVPEIANLPDKYLFSPWLAPENVLKQSALKLGVDYPLPIVDVSFSRERALRAFGLLRHR
jgi:deoxyribodipyrimidine photo-lyase